MVGARSLCWSRRSAQGWEVETDRSEFGFCPKWGRAIRNVSQQESFPNRTEKRAV